MPTALRPDFRGITGVASRVFTLLDTFVGMHSRLFGICGLPADGISAAASRCGVFTGTARPIITGFGGRSGGNVALAIARRVNVGMHVQVIRRRETPADGFDGNSGTQGRSSFRHGGFVGRHIALSGVHNGSTRVRTAPPSGFWPNICRSVPVFWRKTGPGGTQILQCRESSSIACTFIPLSARLPV